MEEIQPVKKQKTGLETSRFSTRDSDTPGVQIEGVTQNNNLSSSSCSNPPGSPMRPLHQPFRFNISSSSGRSPLEPHAPLAPLEGSRIVRSDPFLSPLHYNPSFNAVSQLPLSITRDNEEAREVQRRHKMVSSFNETRKPLIMERLGDILSVLKRKRGAESSHVNSHSNEELLWDNLITQAETFVQNVESMSSFCQFLTNRTASGNINNGYFCILPNEIIYQIFSYLEVKDLSLCRCVNREWNKIIADDEIYKLICIKKSYPLKKPDNRSWKWMALAQSRIFPENNPVKKGCGTFHWPDHKGYYIGEWDSDQRHGYGVQQWSDGSQYHGEWYQDNKHGQGTMTWADGQCYTGEWRNNRKEGRGVEVWADGRRYVGEYKNSNMDGEGVYSWPGGDYYEGEWKDDNMHGHGTYTWPNGSTYCGNWANDEHNGQGRYTCGPESYEGEWRNNLRHGRGREMWGNGVLYEGGWKDNKKDGEGVFTWPDGDYVKGRWENGKRMGVGGFVKKNQQKVFYQLWRDIDSDELDKGEERLIELGTVEEYGEGENIDLERVSKRKSDMDRANEEEETRDRKKTKLVEPLAHKPGEL
ncbi:putative nexus protein [Planoprotostelium fungivorum]|uniref:Putative nexus protein n=1 Tax=Planoprotostelium fungivorum TaxID=1890364 RepID=A0A2P6MRP5_9EUKA|nr:putative nexus protein [Planoprotostelium fungivorum]